MGTKMVLFGELSFGLRRCLAIMTVMFGGKIVTPESTLPTVKNGVLGCRTSKNRWHQEDGILHVNISRQHLKTSARKLQMDNDSKHTSKMGLRTTEPTYWTGNHKALTSSWENVWAELKKRVRAWRPYKPDSVIPVLSGGMGRHFSNLLWEACGWPLLQTFDPS